MTTSIRLSEQAKRRLDALVSETGRSRSFYLSEMIEKSLDDLEDYYLAANVLERVREGKEKIFSADKVRTHLGLAE